MRSTNSSRTKNPSIKANGFNQGPRFFIRVSEDEINIAENLENLHLESAQSNRKRTPTTSECMYSLAPVFSIVMIERVGKMKKVVEDPRPLQDGSLAPFALCSPLQGIFPTFR